MTVVAAVFVGLLGLTIGSFLNVVIHRVPHGLSVVSPPSACPRCGSEIGARDNVPVLSWMLLRGRCRHCAAPIAVRYPLVEALTGALFLGCWLRFHDDPVVVPVLVFVAAGIALAVIDLDLHRLPFAITRPLFVALVVSFTGIAALDDADPVATALGSTAVWTALFAVLHFGTGGRGMGFGDVVLAPSCGLLLGWLGWGPSLVGLFLGFAIGAVIGVIRRAGGGLGRRAQIPYGPFMLAGVAAGLFFGDPVWDAYLGTFAA